MKKISKNIIRLLLFIISLTILFGVCLTNNKGILVLADSYTNTNHPEFQKISIPNNTIGELLINLSEKVKEEARSCVKWRLFGWSVTTITKNAIVYYVGDTIFSKSNNTSSNLDFIYTYEIAKTIETSIAVDGSIDLKLTGKIKSVNTGLDSAIRTKIGKKEEVVTSETTKVVITVPAKTKLSVIVKGEARLNNGTSKYYFFGIPFKKGEWEYIDIVTEYYDYYEEKIS